MNELYLFFKKNVKAMQFAMLWRLYLRKIDQKAIINVRSTYIHMYMHIILHKMPYNGDIYVDRGQFYMITFPKRLCLRDNFNIRLSRNST